jgi:hypothetical protein
MSLMGMDPFLMGSHVVGRKSATSSMSLSNPFLLVFNLWIDYPVYL